MVQQWRKRAAAVKRNCSGRSLFLNKYFQIETLALGDALSLWKAKLV
jgi:hypothetical protein